MGQPCLTPIVRFDTEVLRPSLNTVVRSCKIAVIIRLIRYAGVPHEERMSPRRLVSIISNALLRSMERIKVGSPLRHLSSLMRRRTKMWSSVDLLFRKPAWYSGMSLMYRFTCNSRNEA